MMATYMRRMRNNNVEIRIADSSLILSPAIIVIITITIIIIIIIIIIILVVVVVDDDTYYWVYSSSDHPFQVYFKVRQNRVFGQQIEKTVFKLFNFHRYIYLYLV